MTLQRQPDGTYVGVITIFQKFKGYDKEGRLVYQDTTKERHYRLCKTKGNTNRWKTDRLLGCITWRYQGERNKHIILPLLVSRPTPGYKLIPLIKIKPSQHIETVFILRLLIQFDFSTNVYVLTLLTLNS